MPAFGKGKPTSHPEILEISVITEADLANFEPAETSKEIGTQLRMRDSHHRIAHLFALGLRNYEIEEITGYSKARLSTLRASPAMVQLIEEYRKDVVEVRQTEADHAFSNVVRLRNLATTELLDRFEDDEAREKISNGHLITLVADGLDRTGYPKRRESVNINGDFASRLDRAIEASNKAKLIEHDPPSQQPQIVSNGGGAGPMDVTPPRPSAPLPVETIVAEIIPPRRKIV